MTLCALDSMPSWHGHAVHGEHDVDTHTDARSRTHTTCTRRQASHPGFLYFKSAFQMAMVSPLNLFFASIALRASSTSPADSTMSTTNDCESQSQQIQHRNYVH